MLESKFEVIWISFLSLTVYSFCPKERDRPKERNYTVR